MYVNEYCKPCLWIILNERREKYYNEHPNKRYNAEFWKDIDRIQLKEKRKLTKESRNPVFNYGMGDKLRRKLRSVLRNKSPKALDSYNELIGCSISDLKSHLESNFMEGMSWGNYGLGGWHIDHILPCVVYDLNDPEEQMKCFHYTNLQPLWAKTNFDKNMLFQENFDSITSLDQFINTHKIPASAKIKIKTNKAGKTTYRIIFKIH